MHVAIEPCTRNTIIITSVFFSSLCLCRTHVLEIGVRIKTLVKINVKNHFASDSFSIFDFQFLFSLKQKHFPISILLEFSIFMCSCAKTDQQKEEKRAKKESRTYIQYCISVDFDKWKLSHVTCHTFHIFVHWRAVATNFKWIPTFFESFHLKFRKIFEIKKNRKEIFGEKLRLFRHC